MKVLNLLNTGLFLMFFQLLGYAKTVEIYDYPDADPEPEDISGTVVDAPFGSAVRRFYIKT